MAGSPGLSLADGMDLAGVSYATLWLDYIALGGSGTVSELRDHVAELTPIDNHEHDVIAQAINETFLDQGGDHPVSYRGANA